MAFYWLFLNSFYKLIKKVKSSDTSIRKRGQVGGRENFPRRNIYRVLYK